MGSVAEKLIRAGRTGHPGLWLVVVVACWFRLVFLYRAPPLFVGGDSESYIQPAVELLWGLGFEPKERRAPGYSLFMAGTFAALGLSLQSLVFAQHILGVITSIAAWALGQSIFGRPGGLIAGLLTASNGYLLIYEHYVMAETLFVCLVALSLLALVSGVASGAHDLLGVCGSLIGLAIATRHQAQLLVPLAVLAVLLTRWGWRRSVGAIASLMIGLLIVIAPWLTWDYLPDRSLAAGMPGEALAWRLTRSDTDFFKGRRAPRTDEASDPARRFAWEQAADRELPSDIAPRLQQRFGLSAAGADRVLQEISLEAIRQQPEHYLATSAGILLEHLVGQDQWLGGQGKDGGRTRFANVESRYGWWDDRALALLENPSASQQNEFRRAQAISSFYQPHRLGWPLAGLATLGLVYAALHRNIPAMVLGLAIIGLTGSAALLAGDFPRFRYPAEPLLAVLQAGGLVALVKLAQLLIRRRPQFTSRGIEESASPSRA